MFTGHDVLIAGLAVVQKNLTGQSGLNKKLEGTIDRRITDTGISRFDLKIKILNSDMLMSRKKNIKNHVPLTGGSQTPVRDKRVKYFFLFVAQNCSTK